jgi:hypothetical protein
MTGRDQGFLMMRLGSWGLVVTLATVACNPKEDSFGCKPVDASGGDVVGAWSINPALPTSCAARYERLVSNDWCSQLVWDANGVRQAYLGHPFLGIDATGIRVSDGMTTPTSLTFTQAPALEDPTKIENKYEAELHFGPATASTTFPKSCLTAYGHAADDCNVFAGDLTTYLGDPSAAWQSFNNTALAFQPFYPNGLLPQPTFSNIMCNAETSSAGGCTCTYEITLDVPDHGTWTNERQTVLTLYSDTAAPPYDLDYSSDGSTLNMSGHEGLDVMGQRGLRKLIWRKP